MIAPALRSGSHGSPTVLCGIIDRMSIHRVSVDFPDDEYVKLEQVAAELKLSPAGVLRNFVQKAQPGGSGWRPPSEGHKKATVIEAEVVATSIEVPAEVVAIGVELELPTVETAPT